MLCAEGFAMDAIFSNGLFIVHPWHMETLHLFSGSGLTGGGEIGDITIAVNFSRVQQRQSTMECAQENLYKYHRGRCR